jgi:cytochrome c553
MKMLALLVLLLAPLAAPAQPPADRTGPDIANGELIAVGGGPGGLATACFTCHGIRGEGDAAGAFPRLAGQYAFYLYKQLRDYAAETRPDAVMSPIARQLGDADMADVAAYYAAIVDAPYGAPPRVDARVLQHGRELAARGDPARGIEGCANCHGVEGRGMAPSFPYLAGQHAAYTRRELELWQQGLRRNDPLHLMEDIARRMTAKDIEAVALYFATVQPAQRETLAPATQQAPNRAGDGPHPSHAQ